MELNLIYTRNSLDICAAHSLVEFSKAAFTAFSVCDFGIYRGNSFRAKNGKNCNRKRCVSSLRGRVVTAGVTASQRLPKIKRLGNPNSYVLSYY